MENKIFLSVAIPTYNRANFLDNLLNSIMPQAEEFNGAVQVCISNNCSEDNTREVVTKFKEKYPGLIKYSENKENLGGDKNVLRAIEMCDGDFVWAFGDDDSMLDNGLKTVINFIKNNYREDIGLIILRVKLFQFDKLTGKKIIYDDTFDKNKPEKLKIDRTELIGVSFPNIAFLSILVFNNKPLKKMITEDGVLLKKNTETSHILLILISSLFLKYPYLNGIVFNRDMVYQEIPRYKYFVEDKFILHYQRQKKLNNLLLSSKYMSSNYAYLITRRYKGLRLGFIVDMLVMRAFDDFNYFSYFGCLKLFFQNSPITDALLFSSVFSFLFLIPSAVLISLYKGLLMVRYGKEWKLKWNAVNNIYSIVSGGDRRRNE